MFFEKCDMNKTKLPTKRDVLQYLLFLKHYGTSKHHKNRHLNIYSEEVIKELCSLWHRAKIPTKSRTGIRKCIGRLVKYYYEVRKHPERYKENEWTGIFLISQCKCGIESKKRGKCAAGNKIPQSAKDFFIDQCGPRLLSFKDEPEHSGDVEMVDGFINVLEDNVSIVTKTSPISAGYAPNTSEEEEFATSRREISPTVESQLKVSDIRLRNFRSALDRSDTSLRFGSLHATMLIRDLRFSIGEKAMKDFSPGIAIQ